MTNFSHTPPAPRDAASPPASEAVAWRNLAVPALAAALLLAYGVLVAWPMRIWHRPVSPHTHMVGTLGISWGGALTYIGAVLLLFALYGVALWLVLSRRARPPAVIVLGAAAAFCAVLLFTHPLTSTDVFNYIASARVYWVHDANPLTTAPLAFPDDPFFGLLTFWQNIPSPYGPLWSLIAGGPAAVGGDDPARAVLAFKATSVLAFLGAGWLLYLTARRMRPDSGVAALLAFTWNPLAVFHVAGNGHNDAVMVFFLALCLYCLARGWAAWALVALAASALIKFATLLLVPVLLVWWLRSGKRSDIRPIALGAGGALLLTVAAYAPFWEGRETFATTLDEGTYYTVSVPAALRGALERGMSAARAEELTSLIVRGAFVFIVGLVLLRLRGRRLSRLAEAGFLVFFAYLTIAATYFAPWYVLWALTFAVLLPYRRDVLWPALTLSLTAMSVLVAAVWFRERFAPDPRVDWYGMHLAAALAVAPLPILVWLWTVRYPAGTLVRRRALEREAQNGHGRPGPAAPRA